MFAIAIRSLNIALGTGLLLVACKAAPLYYEGTAMQFHYPWICLQDAWADVQLLLLLNTGLVIAGGMAKRVFVDKSTTVGPVEDFWNDIFDVSAASRLQLSEGLAGPLDSIHVPESWPTVFANTPLLVYWMQSHKDQCRIHIRAVLKSYNVQVLIVWLGEFPEVPKGIPAQIFSIAMAVTGLAAFAIVLALVEQLVLQILTANVSRGSQVYEKGHILVLAWAWTQRDREVIWKILSQASSHSQEQQADCTEAS